jgi:hypothetical protein
MFSGVFIAEEADGAGDKGSGDNMTVNRVTFLKVLLEDFQSWDCFPQLPKYQDFHSISTAINPLKMKRICFIQGLSAYRAVNTLHFGYKNQSLNVL